MTLVGIFLNFSIRQSNPKSPTSHVTVTPEHTTLEMVVLAHVMPTNQVLLHKTTPEYSRVTEIPVATNIWAGKSRKSQSGRYRRIST